MIMLAGVGVDPDLTMWDEGETALHAHRHVNDAELLITGPATDDRGDPRFEGWV